MDEPKIPVFLVVGLWAASGLAVLTYTAVAFKSTASGAEGLVAVATSPGLVAATGLLENELNPTVRTPRTPAGPRGPLPHKPLDRGKFRPSR